jgi:hypothetical protein
LISAGLGTDGQAEALRLLLDLLGDDVVAEADALVTDVDGGPAMSFLTSFWLFPQKEQERFPWSSRFPGGTNP